MALAESVTMSSREISELTGKAHKNVLADIRSMFVELEIDSADYSAQYRDSTGRSLPCFNLDRELTETLLTGYSAKLRRKVIVRLRELERGVMDAVAVQPALPITQKLAGELAIAESFARMSRMAQSGQLSMASRIASNNGLDGSFLPVYAVDSAPDAIAGSSMPTKALSLLLQDFEVPISAVKANIKLGEEGYLAKVARKNSKGETVYFWSVTDKGLHYGKNVTSPNNQRETQPHWYVERFDELINAVL